MDKWRSGSSQEVIPKQQTNSYELSSKYNNTDKTTGDYSRYSMTEKVTENQRHVERGSRREGVRDEYKTTENIKVGNEKGYTEYQVEETYRNVTYDNNNTTSGATKYVTGGESGGVGGGTGGVGGGIGGSGYEIGGDNSYVDNYELIMIVMIMIVMIMLVMIMMVMIVMIMMMSIRVRGYLGPC